ncbi:response regulator transcription factor [Nocardiopsis sp. MT53]|uniref:Response regulator transcription factor n=1 Tax=Nocardiopsis changdeensis TaxID=2831969 RepID=A0ABX8BRJ2_9ACTN|nr:MULTISPECIES: response regulator transcription factor [Nocardiopsis]QUX24340.1 response regulator transcription factor [Nocardiopsis changdeensis]QYX34731.1 response regulator transcription factor [Nocardiopsis sp. MT53]
MGGVDTPVRVLLVDDDPLVLTGLRIMLSGAPGLAVVGEAADGEQVVAAVAEHRPHVVLMDVRMPGMDGIAATRALRTGGADDPQVIVLTTFDADDTVARALRAGAAGYLLKHTEPERIVEAVHRAASGEPVLSPAVARALMDRVAAGTGPGTGTRDGGAGPGDAAGGGSAGPGPGGGRDAERRRAARERLALLTVREREVADAVAAGLSNTEIARALHMSLGTVKAHISSALTKLDLAGRVPLALLAHDARDPDLP